MINPRFLFYLDLELTTRFIQDLNDLEYLNKIVNYHFKVKQYR